MLYDYVKQLCDSTVNPMIPLKFLADMQRFLDTHIHSFHIYLQLPERCNKHKKLVDGFKCYECDNLMNAKIQLLRANCLNYVQVKAFVDLCLIKVKKAIVEPGTAVGAVSATSIGIIKTFF